MDFKQQKLVWRHKVSDTESKPVGTSGEREWGKGNTGWRIKQHKLLHIK